MSKKALLLVGAVLLIAGGAAFLLSGGPPSGPRIFREDLLHSVVTGDLRYDFDCSWRREVLSRRGEDGIWRSVDRPPDAELAPYRALLLEHLHLETLEDIPEEGKDDRDSLRGIGYL